MQLIHELHVFGVHVTIYDSNGRTAMYKLARVAHLSQSEKTYPMGQLRGTERPEVLPLPGNRLRSGVRITDSASREHLPRMIYAYAYTGYTLGGIDSPHGATAEYE